MQINIDNGLKPNNNSLKIESAKSAKDCFVQLKEKYPDVCMNMSSSFRYNNNSSTTLNFSPEYVKKSVNDPEVAGNMERLAGLAKSFPQYLGTHNTLPDGTKVGRVSFVVDENGGVSCSCEYVRQDSEDNKSRGLQGILERLLQKKEEEAEDTQEATKYEHGKRLDFYEGSSSLITTELEDVYKCSFKK